MPTPDNLQSAMSYTIVGASTAASLGGIGPFLTTGSTGGAPNWPASSEGHQIMQGSACSQTGNTGFGQGALSQYTIRPFGRPEPVSGNVSGVALPAQPQPPVQQQQPQALPVR